MKKNILIFCTVLTMLSLTAFTYINLNEPITCQKVAKQVGFDLFYNVDSRFKATISKEALHKATSVLEIVPKEAENWWKASFQTVKVTVIQDGDEMYALGDNKVLNAAQIKLLQSTDYSNNFYINARSKNSDFDDYAYSITIIPEKEAEYIHGYDALITYLKENSREKTAIIKENQLQPGKVSFTVTKEGTIANVKLTSTSGYASVDKMLIELIKNMPGKWNPAENSRGEKVEQELVFFFGLEGC